VNTIGGSVFAGLRPGPGSLLALGLPTCPLRGWKFLCCDGKVLRPIFEGGMAALWCEREEMRSGSGKRGPCSGSWSSISEFLFRSCGLRACCVWYTASRCASSSASRRLLAASSSAVRHGFTITEPKSGCGGGGTMRIVLSGNLPMPNFGIFG
jgi:hypothetical protein